MNPNDHVISNRKNLVQETIDRLLYCKDYEKKLKKLNAKFDVPVMIETERRVYGKVNVN